MSYLCIVFFIFAIFNIGVSLLHCYSHIAQHITHALLPRFICHRWLQNAPPMAGLAAWLRARGLLGPPPVHQPLPAGRDNPARFLSSGVYPDCSGRSPCVQKTGWFVSKVVHFVFALLAVQSFVNCCATCVHALTMTNLRKFNLSP